MVGGAAGDMLLAAWLDAGVDRAALEGALRGIVAKGWELVTERVDRKGISALYADLSIPGEDDHAHDEHGHHHHHHERSHHGHRLRDIVAIVEGSTLTPRQIARASTIYRRIAEAEARVHGTDPDTVEFHEVGQLDAILDVAATCVALDLLGIDELYCSAFPQGYGLAKMAHGMYPTPSPATLELLRGAPMEPRDAPFELVTVTGAAILTTLATATGTRVPMRLERIGYGAGRKEMPIPNVVRVMVGERVPAPSLDGTPAAGDPIVVLEANIDDMSPQRYELALERIFAAGALDAWLAPIVMKKGRPATLLAALARPRDETAVAEAILRETTTIGVRVRREERYVLPREIVAIDTPYGPVRLKRVRLDGRLRARAEYDDLLRIAREHELPLEEVTRVVDAAAAAAELPA